MEDPWTIFKYSLGNPPPKPSVRHPCCRSTRKTAHIQSLVRRSTARVRESSTSLKAVSFAISSRTLRSSTSNCEDFLSIASFRDRLMRRSHSPPAGINPRTANVTPIHILTSFFGCPTELFRVRERNMTILGSSVSDRDSRSVAGRFDSKWPDGRAEPSSLGGSSTDNTRPCTPHEGENVWRWRGTFLDFAASSLEPQSLLVEIAAT